MKKRRSLTQSDGPDGPDTPDVPDAPDAIHATRRGGARLEISGRVTLCDPSSLASTPVRRAPSVPPSAPDSGSERVTVPERTSDAGVQEKPRAIPIEGWALNVGRGGIRVILEVHLQLGTEYDVTFSQGTNGDVETRRCRVVWVQDEPDGVVAGLSFCS